MSPESVQDMLDSLAYLREQAERVKAQMEQTIKDLIPSTIQIQIEGVKAELEPEIRAIEERAGIVDARVRNTTLEIGASIKSQSLQAVYMSPQRKMDWKQFDRYLVGNPELAAELLAMVKVGEPSVQIRKV